MLVHVECGVLNVECGMWTGGSVFPHSIFDIRDSKFGAAKRQRVRAFPGGLAISLSAVLRNMNAPIAFWSFVTTGTLT